MKTVSVFLLTFSLNTVVKMLTSWLVKQVEVFFLDTDWKYMPK